jgi:hypothetical protein
MDPWTCIIGEQPQHLPPIGSIITADIGAGVETPITDIYIIRGGNLACV